MGHLDHTPELGVANGIATLGAGAELTLAQLPSYIGATAVAAGTKGAVPPAAAGEEGYLLVGGGTWGDPAGILAGAETQIASAQDIITTVSVVFEPMANMSITPGAGTYLVLFTASASMNKNAQQVLAVIRANGVEDPQSVRELGGQAGNIGNFSSAAVLSVADGQVIDVYWRITSAGGGGAGTAIERSLVLVRTDL
jgi:hypothetical protein